MSCTHSLEFWGSIKFLVREIGTVSADPQARSFMLRLPVVSITNWLSVQEHIGGWFGETLVRGSVLLFFFNFTEQRRKCLTVKCSNHTGRIIESLVSAGLIFVVLLLWIIREVNFNLNTSRCVSWNYLIWFFFLQYHCSLYTLRVVPPLFKWLLTSQLSFIFLSINLVFMIIIFIANCWSRTRKCLFLEKSVIADHLSRINNQQCYFPAN